ncbi:Hypothetical_protein [Hexamita inflata]|uniref:Hypothetical_protein n=1 Tax=Hexamita inflata TaxID=28002 RepID=A0ABP1M213_9EUKA
MLIFNVVNFSLQIGLEIQNKKIFSIKRILFANCTKSKHDIQRMPEITSEHFKFSLICKVDYTNILQLLKSTKLFTFKIVKIPSRKSNQYKVVFTEISESSFNCSFIDQYYVPLSRKMVLHTKYASILVETGSNPSLLKIIQRIYPVKLNMWVQ